MPAPRGETVAVAGGTGALGHGLALRLAAAGLAVRLGSRDPAAAVTKAVEVADAVPGADVVGARNEEAVAGAALVVLAVPFAAHAATLKRLAKVVEDGQVVLDTTVPLATAVGGRPTRLLGVPQGSAAEQARELLPARVEVVAGLHSVAAASLADLDHELDEDVLLCGDDAGALDVVAQVVGRVPGLRPVACGTLTLAHSLEALTPLVISVNVRHKVRAGIALRGLGVPASSAA
ncbi:NADPH-dependent F420 reductase [Conexibacter sp. SYSU D00693]|uniref:NADPH-dependent F420 reductase n=1 Tax=Conexibacter sp. SYSU D00693 TaxID=2812560 RepID=UPI00196AE162|nr:NADPH-dependent F420 reductase [Conexibacter sp. SYSU D00693]